MASNIIIEPEVTYQNDTTAEKVAYNTFCTILEADTYHGRRLNNSSWDSADEDTRQKALYHATDIMHRQKWIGAPTGYEQRLAWPRRFVPNRLSLNQGFRGDLEYIDINTPVSLTFRYLADDFIPEFLTDATAELANYLISKSSFR